jgi:hypothetical protein
MTWARRLLLRLRTLFYRNRSTQQLDNEVQFHIDQQIAENIAAGMNREEARHAALRTFGNPTVLKEETRDTWGWIWWEQAAQDLRYGFRLLLRNRGFTAVTVSTLALGIGSTAALYSIFDGTYLHTGPDTTRPVGETALLAQQSQKQSEVWRFSAPEYFDIAHLRRSFDGFFAMRYWSAAISENVASAENPERVVVLRVTANFLTGRGPRAALLKIGGRLRAALVLVEVALAFVVIMGAGLMVRTYRQLSSMDMGFQPDHVLTMRIALPELKYGENAKIANFFRELLERTRALPGIVDVAASSARPVDPAGVRDFSIPGRSLNTGNGVGTARYRVITPEYFALIRTPLHKGRSFAEHDGPGTTGVAIVNETFARTYFPEQVPWASRFAWKIASSAPLWACSGPAASWCKLSAWSQTRTRSHLL